MVAARIHGCPHIMQVESWLKIARPHELNMAKVDDLLTLIKMKSKLCIRGDIMAIPEEQLETWSHQGATVGSANTHNSIRVALARHSWPAGMNRDAYLQGSYRNHTISELIVMLI